MKINAMQIVIATAIATEQKIDAYLSKFFMLPSTLLLRIRGLPVSGKPWVVPLAEGAGIHYNLARRVNRAGLTLHFHVVAIAAIHPSPNSAKPLIFHVALHLDSADSRLARITQGCQNRQSCLVCGTARLQGTVRLSWHLHSRAAGSVIQAFCLPSTVIVRIIGFCVSG